MFEESFRTSERAIEMFGWPHKYEIWIQFLQAVVSRFKHTKVERVRDLFAKCIQRLPMPSSDSSKGQIQDQGKLFFVMCAKFEEEYGMISGCLDILRQAVTFLEQPALKFDVFNLLLAKTLTFKGIMETRKEFEQVFEFMTGPHLIQLGLRFAKLERKLGETERCRAIYEHLSQFVNPYSQTAANKIFWNVWDKFELHHGDKDSYTDFVRVKKTVELRYS
jgi:pre-mRNA-splicing factor SYF1